MAAGPGAARFVGSTVHRKEDRRLLSGHGQYVGDVTLPRMLHGAFLRSDVAKARLVHVDTAAAKALPGVVAVFTWLDFHEQFGEAWHGMLGEQLVVPPPLAITDVRYVGDPIAFVVAESRYVAEDAVDLIEVEMEVESAVVDYATASSRTDSIVHAGWGLQSNAMVQVPFTPMNPDLDEVFAKAAHVVETTIVQNRYLCVPMETRGMLASWDPGLQEMQIVCSTQSVHETRTFYSRYLSVPEAAISVTARDVGGGFGQKMFVHREECAVVLASRLLGRPVKWIEDRRENLTAAGHSRNEQGKVRLAIDADGVIQALTIEHVADVGAYPPCPAIMDPLLVTGPYRIPRYGFSTELVWTNTMGKAAYRGPWMFETTAREMAIAVAAQEIGMDPVELRRKNLLSYDELPHVSPTGKVLQEITPLESLDAAVAALGYEAFRAEQAAARAEGRWLGLGISVYVEPTSMEGSTLATEGATVRIDTSGKVTAQLSTTSHGQSVETTMAQIIADELGVDYDDVTVIQGTTNAPYGPGTGGSRTAVVAGGAARSAAVAVRDKVLKIAAHMMEAAPEDLEVGNGAVSVKGTPSRSVSMKEVAVQAYNNAHLLPVDIDAGLEATIRFKPNRFPTWSNATHLCVVEIDAETLIPKVVRYIVAEDCGKMINPKIVEGQVYGGVVQGIGGVLYEDFRYDSDGSPTTTTFLDYLLPTTGEIPSIEIEHLETVSTTNPGGFKGIGEGGAIGAHAAVANAVGDALAHLGVKVTSTPLGPQEIFALVQQATATV